MPSGQEERPRDDHQREREEAAEAVADHRGDLVQAELLQAPAVLDRPRGVEVDLVRRHRRPEQADDEVEVHREAAADVRAGDETVGDPPPVRVQLDRRDREDEQAEAEVAEHPLDPLERERPGGDGQSHHGQRNQQSVRQAREELEADRHAAHLGRAGHQVDHLRGDEGRESRAEAGPLADEVEDRALGDRGHPPAHLRVDDDPGDADHDHPQELVAEGRARLRVEDEVADVDEAADRREDPERDRENVLHAHLSSSAAASSSRASRGCSAFEACPTRFRSALTFPAREVTLPKLGLERRLGRGRPQRRGLLRGRFVEVPRVHAREDAGRLAGACVPGEERALGGQGLQRGGFLG